MASPIRLPAIPADRCINNKMLSAATRGVELMTPLWTECRNWTERMTIWEAIVSNTLRDQSDPRRAMAASVLLLTALLEQMGDVDIRTVAAAALYRCSMHAEWRQAADLFIEQTDEAMVGAWMDARPEFGTYLVHVVWGYGETAA